MVLRMGSVSADTITDSARLYYTTGFMANHNNVTYVITVFYQRRILTARLEPSNVPS